jgi:outer membrane immunogenic protein
MRIISALAVSGAIVAASLTTASAADLYVKAPPMVVETYNWTGWYGGAHGGYLFDGQSRWSFPTVGTSVNAGFETGVVGVHAGWQHQFGNFAGLGGLVLGFEGATSIGTDKISGGPACPNPAFTCDVMLNKYSTLGGRLGIAFDRWMVYGSGGYAGATIDTRFTPGAPAGDGGASKWHNGWYAGAGVDYLLWRDKRFSWILGVEYQHIDLDSTLHNPSAGGFAAGFSRNVDATADVIRGRLSVKLDGPAWFW